MKKAILAFEGNQLNVSIPALDVSTVRGSDFFRLHLDTGENHELEVTSSQQEPTAVTPCEGGLCITYDTVVAEDGQRFAIGLTVWATVGADGALTFRAEVAPESEGVRVNELQLPILTFDSLGAPSEQEVLYLPDGLGARYQNPRAHLLSSAANTEFLHADYKTLWYNAIYPHGGRANAHLSMPWLALECAGHTFSLLSLCKDFRVTALSLGRTPLSLPDCQLLFAVSHYPAATAGERAGTGEAVFTVSAGDWRQTAAYYRAWYDRTVGAATPADRPDWVRDMTGWQRIIMKHQYGEVYFRYQDLPDIYRNGAKYGIHTLLVFGWWQGRFDNGYPVYEPDPALGGEDALREAIAEVRRLGGRVILYSNGNLIDVKSEYYWEVGRRIAARDIDGNEYREHYGFSNNGTLLDLYGYKSFVTACHATEEWQDKLIENGCKKLSFAPDGVFYDQLCCCHKCCFDRRHLHGARIDREPEYRVRNAAAIRTLLSPGQSFGTEVIADRFTPYVDYIHGCGMAMSYSPFAYPDLYRHTFPEVVISNRWAHAEEPGFVYKLNYAFVTGLIFDVSIYRGRRVDMSGAPQYAARIAELVALRERYHAFFYGGRFVSAERELALPPRIHAAVYERDGARILALCNNTAAEVSLTVYGKNVTLAAAEATVITL